VLWLSPVPGYFSDSCFSAGVATVMDSTRMYSGEAPRFTISSSTCSHCMQPARLLHVSWDHEANKDVNSIWQHM
jgi:hypothetical protein